MTRIERVAFFGSPGFAVPSLDALAADRWAPRRVISQPARPAGRGRQLRQPAVAKWAEDRGVELIQPEGVRDPAFLDDFEAWCPDIAVVVAFGQIFPSRLLEIPRLGCVNVHASLLPRHRGAAPVQAAIAAGDELTGVTTMQMDAGLDTGGILLQRSTPIAAGEAAPQLADRLAVAGGELLVETLAGLESGDLVARPQSEEEATLAPRLQRSDGFVDWTLAADVLERRCRAYRPWPALLAGSRGAPLKLLEVEVLEPVAPAPPGAFLGVEGESAIVACGGGTRLGLSKVQRPGRRAVTGREWAAADGLVAGAVELSVPPEAANVAAGS